MTMYSYKVIEKKENEDPILEVLREKGKDYLFSEGEVVNILIAQTIPDKVRKDAAKKARELIEGGSLIFEAQGISLP